MSLISIKLKKCGIKKVQSDPRTLKYVPDQFVTQEMWHKAVKKKPEVLRFIPDQFVTQEMCNEALKKSSEVVLRWYKGYEQRKAQKAKIK